MLELEAQDTLTAVELNRGEGFTFRLRNGEVRSFVLEDTDACVLLTSCRDTRVEEPDGGTLYHFTCRVRIDGRAMKMERYVCSQESFYEPYVVNGLRIWFDGVQDIFRFATETHGPCRPARHARFAVQDASLSICPEPMQPWCPIEGHFIDVADCYNGDDPWMGPYLGASAHGGMDINHPRGTPIWAPIDLDDGRYLCCTARGANNNRWRGVRRWPDGSTWVLGAYHVTRLLVPERTPIRAGTQVAEGAGVWVGSHDHTHFYFMVKQRGRVFRLDPWILFRQIFEDEKRSGGARLRPEHRGRWKQTVVDFDPPGPTQTGRPVAFADRTRKRTDSEDLSCFWTFGDGSTAVGPNPTHAFPRPGVYPVTLTVESGARRAARTQHLTVTGDPVGAPALVLAAPDEPSFQPRPVHAMDVYGCPPRLAPHTLEFTVRPGFQERPAERRVLLRNAGAGTLAPARIEAVPSGPHPLPPECLILRTEGTGNEQALHAGVALADELGPGAYKTIVRVESDGALNSPQVFRVRMHVRPERPKPQVTVDDLDAGFYCTPWFWVGPRFCHWPERGYGGRYLTSGGRAAAGEFARFTPDLRAGRYEVRFSDRTPFEGEAAFDVRIRHKEGADVLRVQPTRSLAVGTFAFDEGTDGFVELRAENSVGRVLADAVVFQPVT
jgi:hypothetical protein